MTCTTCSRATRDSRSRRTSGTDRCPSSEPVGTFPDLAGPAQAAVERRSSAGSYDPPVAPSHDVTEETARRAAFSQLAGHLRWWIAVPADTVTTALGIAVASCTGTLCLTLYSQAARGRGASPSHLCKSRGFYRKASQVKTRSRPFVRSFGACGSAAARCRLPIGLDSSPRARRCTISDPDGACASATVPDCPARRSSSSLCPGSALNGLRGPRRRSLADELERMPTSPASANDACPCGLLVTSSAGAGRGPRDNDAQRDQEHGRAWRPSAQATCWPILAVLPRSGSGRASCDQLTRRRASFNISEIFDGTLPLASSCLRRDGRLAPCSARAPVVPAVALSHRWHSSSHRKPRRPCRLTARIDLAAVAAGPAT